MLLALPLLPLTEGGVALALWLVATSSAAWEKAMSLQAPAAAKVAGVVLALVGCGHQQASGEG